MQVGVDQSQAGGPSVFDMPKLESKIKGERKRVYLPDPNEIRAAYVHAIGGQSAAAGPGHPVPAWGGNWMCQGDPNILKDSNPFSDPTNCSLCRRVQQGDIMVGKCKRKFITQLVVYNTAPTGQLLQPFGIQIMAFQFADKLYKALVDAQNDWGDLKAHDLMLTCDEPSFKSWLVAVAPEVAMMMDPSYTQLVTQTWQAQARPGADLELILGRPGWTEQEITAKITEVTPASAAAAMQYQAPAIPGTPPGYGAMPPVMAPAGAPQQPMQQYAQAPPAESLYPQAGPFDQAQQVLQQPPAQQMAPPPMQAPPMGQPAPGPGMLPPPMPPTPAPQQQQMAQPQLPPPGALQAGPQDPTAYAPQPGGMAPPPVPAVPDLTAAPPVQAPAPQQPQQQMAPPPMQQPAAMPQMHAPQGQAMPGAPAEPGAPVDLQAMMATPPPPPPA